MAVKTTEHEGKAKISDTILNLSTTAATVASNPGAAANQPLADITASIKEAAKLLTTTTERTAFLNIGMFYICQIAANDSIDNTQTSELINALLESASSIE